jgi:hypothetical protein
MYGEKERNQRGFKEEKRKMMTEEFSTGKAERHMKEQKRTRCVFGRRR